ncbi:TIR domain-containing adapter molecule 1 [Xenopus laevis]|uniref:TIR domain-containing adapter molecule 1 n=2 Tax=Xenopus laevis TaxID=8355 RepID=A0A1L8HW60_XENLA|nr:TIR domain-containing adapter molecule 1 [Xenopus laevis]XP_018109635.1 TIR domain-containing adapter molecule 1 [Xenopus laevis]XP_018109641.1 TIR domain-containing adapter molecule 1 [Xenopus laevis]XP_041417113.1 TIR domain-containing adapter molecule 1 [Xenopus laevis]XP_041417116.1 TIR domain-containing adapter molecule 1 [Xenopus laevis]OCU00345.1 hypothetical protein XELAEV_18006116mg [Xenopus laevis]
MSSCSHQHICDLEEICTILSGIPLYELIACRHRLEHRRPSTDTHKILCGLILLLQDKRPEALKILSLLPHCHMAQHIIQALIGGGTLLENGVLSLPPSQDEKILHTAGEVHALIEQENLCGKEAIKPNKTETENSGDDDAPHTLVSGIGLQIPHIEKSPLSTSLEPKSLQISKSPSVPSTERVPTVPPSTNQKTHGADMVLTSSYDSTNNHTNMEPAVFEIRGDHSVKTSIQESEFSEFTERHKPNGNANTVPSSNNNSYRMPPQCSTYPPPDDSLFFNFVILHVREDTEVACRVCNDLQSLGAGNGTTYCEGFEIPGSNPLTCIQDAVENSAYIILLMTKHFETRWAEFQSNVVLMNSINDENRTASVIPFLPRSDRLPKKNMPLALSTLIPLDETSQIFSRVVRNTFKQDTILFRKKGWMQQQEIKIKRMVDAQRSEQTRHYLHLNQMCGNVGSMSLGAPYMYPQPIPCQPQVIHINNAENVQIGNHNSITVTGVATELCSDNGMVSCDEEKRQGE